MTVKEIIDGLKFTVDMFLFDPDTGETFAEPRNDMDKITIDACKGAIELLKQEPCGDCISRQAALRQAINAHKMAQENGFDFKDICEEYLNVLPVVTPQVKDAVSRQAVLKTLDDIDNVLDEDRTVENYKELLKECYEVLPPVKPQEPKTEQFAKWVASEIFDEMWEYNKDSFVEIACRKLAKLGIVRAKGDEWELIEPQERSE